MDHRSKAEAPELQSLRRQVDQLEQDARELHSALDRARDSDRFLAALRAVNHLIVREKDPGVLAQEVCDALVGTGAFERAWLALAGEGDLPVLVVGAGWGDAFEPFRRRFGEGWRPACWQAARASANAPAVLRAEPMCQTCALGERAPSTTAVVLALRHQGVDHGTLCITLAPGVDVSAAEDSVLNEVADDLGFALHGVRTERQRSAYAQLVAGSEARLSAIFHRSPVGLVLTRRIDGLIVDANAAFAELLGREPGTIIGRTTPELNLWTSPAEREATLSTPPEQEVVRDREVRIRRLGGEERVLRISVEPLELAGEPHLLAVAQDVTERRRIEEALREQDHLLRAMGSAAKIGGWEFDTTSGSGSWTEEVARIHDLPPDAQINVEAGINYYHGESRDLIAAAVRDAVERARPYDLELEILTALGVRKWVRTIAHPVVHDGKVVKVWGSLQDITERKQAEARREVLEEQLRATQKLEAIGTLAGGIAHDFNNLLAVILNYSESALRTLRKADPLRGDILEVCKAAERAALLTKQLLAFGRKQVLQPVPLSLNNTLEELEPMLRRIIGEDVVVVLALAAESDVVLADPSQIEQVVMNLAINARDAMPEGGTLTLSTANVEAGGEPVPGYPNVKAGPYVELCVTDTGVGMSAETRARLFEPFFTTKPPGEGSGLGLATTYGIVKQSGGHVVVESEPGRGTSMRVRLPRELDAKPAAQGTPPVSATSRQRGAETILVVEDEEALREVVRRALESAGYTVLTASGREEALMIAAIHQGAVQLLLTDVVMPRGGGRQVAEELGKRWPALKVLYMSGYTDETIARHGVLDPGTPFVAKPFTTEVLLRKVRETLDGAAGQGRS